MKRDRLERCDLLLLDSLRDRRQHRVVGGGIGGGGVHRGAVLELEAHDHRLALLALARAVRTCSPVIVGDSTGWITFLFPPIVMGFEETAAGPPPRKSRAIVSATVSARSANVATPPLTVTDCVPWSGPLPLGDRGRDHGAVVGRHRVAVRIHLVDDRLGSERLRRPGRTTTAGSGSPTGWRRRADDDRALAGELSPPPVNPSAIDPAVFSARSVNVATPPLTVTDLRALERSAPTRERGRDHGAVIGRHGVAVRVRLVDDRLGRERLAGRRRR